MTVLIIGCILYSDKENKQVSKYIPPGQLQMVRDTESNRNCFIHEKRCIMMLRPSVFQKNYLDDMFDDMFNAPFWGGTGMREVSAMKTDIKETEDGYEIDMELPGFAKEDINADLKDGYLTIRATHSSDHEEKDEGKRYIRKERYSGHYERSFYVGEAVTEEDIKAKFKDGILTMGIPKKEPQPKVEETKKIAIEG